MQDYPTQQNKQNILLEVPYRLKFIDMYDFFLPPIFRADQIGRIVDFLCNDCFSTEITLPLASSTGEFSGIIHPHLFADLK